jgi:hypothetical protein
MGPRNRGIAVMPVYQMQAPDGRTYRIEGPPGASDDEVREAIVAQNPHLAEPEEQSWTTALQRGVARLPGQAMEAATKIGGAVKDVVTSPIETAGKVGQFLGDIAPTPLNILRDQSPLTDIETYKTIANAPAERYGTTARAKETIATDPLGAMMDVSLVGRVAGTALKQVPKAKKLGEALERGSEVFDPLTMASRVVTKIPREVGSFRFGAPEIDELRAAKNAAYAESEQAGAMFDPVALQKFSSDAKTVKFNPKNNPKIANLIEDIDETIKSPQSLRQMDELRQRIKDVEATLEPSDRYLAGQLREKLDDFVDDSLQNPSNFISGKPDVAIPALQNARKLNSQMRKAETLERLLSIADVRASGYTASGLENAIRAQVREFVKDPKAKKLRGFTKEEIQSLRDVAEGGSITNFMRWAGRFAPTGPVSALPSGLASGIDPVTGAMIAGGGITGRIGATGGTRYAVQQAGQLIRGGKSTASQMANLLQQYGDKLSAADPKMAFAVDMARRATAAGRQIDPYYARQLAAQLARMEEE